MAPGFPHTSTSTMLTVAYGNASASVETVWFRIDELIGQLGELAENARRIVVPHHLVADPTQREHAARARLLERRARRPECPAKRVFLPRHR